MGFADAGQAPIWVRNRRARQSGGGDSGLTPYLDRSPKQPGGQYSGGDGLRHRARAAGVLFDEPLPNPIAKLRVQMRTEIKALHQRLKVTSIYVTTTRSRR